MAKDQPDRSAGLYPRSARLLALVVAALSAAVAGCHLAAVPLASAVLRPRVGSATPSDLGLRYRDVVLDGAEGRPLPAWRVAAAGGEPRGIVLLLAENGGTRGSPRMLWLAGVVSEAGADALLVDLRGHGDSPGVNTYGLGETLDLLAVLRTLEREEPRLGIGAVGFSLGASCILRAMSMTDGIRGAVVMASYARLDSGLLAHELRFQAHGGALSAAASLVSPGLLRLALGFWAGFPRLPEPEELSTDRPVLLFHCSGDPEIPFENAAAIAAGAAARGSPLELRALPRDRHLPPLGDGGVWDPFAEELRRSMESWFGPR